MGKPAESLFNLHNRDDHQRQSHCDHILRKGNRGKGKRLAQEGNKEHRCRDQQGEDQRAPQPPVLLFEAEQGGAAGTHVEGMGDSAIPQVPLSSLCPIK